MNRIPPARGISRCHVIVGLLAAVMILTHSAIAQDEPEPVADEVVCAALMERMPPPAIDRAFTKQFLRRDLAVFAEELELDQAQQIILESIYRDYEDDFDAGALRTREEIATLRPVATTQDLAQRQRQRQVARQRMLTELREEMKALDEAGSLDAATRQQMIQDALERFEKTYGNADPVDAQEARARILAFIRELNAITTEWVLEHETIVARFAANVQAILTTDQGEKWQSAMRRLRRVNSISRGELSGEYVDLHVVISRVDVDPASAAEIEAHMRSYDAQLDAALQARNEFLDTVSLKMFEALDTCDLNELLRVIDRESALRTAVRDVNDQFAEAIASLLTPRQAAQFTHEWGRRAYPRIFNETRAGRLFASAISLADLDSATRSSLLSLFQSYEAEMVGAREGLLRTIRSEEPRLARQEMEQHIASLRGRQVDAEPGRITTAMSQRLSMERIYTEQLADLLGQTNFDLIRSRESTAQRTSTAEQRQSAVMNQEQRRAMFRKFDVDGDGRLNDDEVAAMREALEEQAAGSGGG